MAYLKKITDLTPTRDVDTFAIALLRVLELHKPVTTTIGSFCKACGITSDYPCETIQAIEKELK